MMLRLWSMIIPFLLLGCSDTVSSQCTADYSYDMQDLTFIGFDESTSGDQSDIVSWLWEFGDGSTSTQQNPEHTFQEVEDYDVCLTITTANGCTDQVCYEVDVCELTMQYELGSCNSDNEIPVDLTINDPYDEAKEVTISVDGMAVTPEPVDIEDDEPVIMTVFLPGDGLEHSITAQSADIGTCVVSDTITTEDCTSDCFLSALQIEYTNQTSHVVEIGDNFFSPENLTVEAGDQIEWQWLAEGHTTTSDATSGPDSWNSGELGAGASFQTVIDQPGTHPYYCIPHGGPGGVGMSATIVANCPPGNSFEMEVSFNTSVADPEGYNLYLDGALLPGSPYDYSGTGMQTQIVQLVGDGQEHQIMVEDVQDTSCTISKAFTTPDCDQSPECMLNVDANEAGGCNNENQIPVELTVSEINGGAEGFEIFVDGTSIPGNPYMYHASGTTVVSVLLPGDGLSHNIEIRDVEDPTCQANVEWTTPDCAVPCSLANLNAESGSAVTHVVEVQDFQFAPMHLDITEGDSVEFVWTGSIDHTTTSDTPSGPDHWNSGLLNNGATYTVTDLSVGTHPYYCIPHGGPGGVGMSGTIQVNPDCNGDSVGVNITFSDEAGSFEGYEVLIDGALSSNSPYQYDTSGLNQIFEWLPGDGQEHSITIRDLADSTCSVSINYNSPNCGNDPCNLSVTAEEAGDCSNGQVDVELTVEQTRAGSGFRVLVDSIPLAGNPYSYDSSGTTVLTVSLPGDGSIHELIVEDLDSTSCKAVTEIRTTDCSSGCQLTDLQVNPGQVTHIVEVRDFEFVPGDITIESGDRVAFIWKGSMEHTVTSDDQTSNRSFDSGYLNQGDTFEVKLTESGVRPYYCIPHGAPGGVGMAGTVTVLKPCADGRINSEITFQESGGSVQGYHIYLDDSLVSNSAIGYATGGGMNNQMISLPADGASHEIRIQDIGHPNCTIQRSISLPDCSDPCAFFQADFSLSRSSQGLSVQFEDQSIGTVESWLWGFGDGMTSQEQFPVHQYNMPGEYTVCLYVQNTMSGCQSNRCETIDLSLSDVDEVDRMVHELTISPSLSTTGRSQWVLRGIEEDDNYSDMQLTFYDIQGRILERGWVRGQDRIRVNLNRAPSAGMYFIELRSHQRIYRGRLVIQ